MKPVAILVKPGIHDLLALLSRAAREGFEVQLTTEAVQVLVEYLQRKEAA